MKRFVLLLTVLILPLLLTGVQVTENTKKTPVRIDPGAGHMARQSMVKRTRFENERQETRELELQTRSLQQSDATPASVNLDESKVTFVKDSSGDVICNGIVKNSGSTTPVFVKITVKFYDGSGSLLGSDWTYVKGGPVVKLSSGTHINAVKKGYTCFFYMYTSVSYSQAVSYTATYDYSTYSYTTARSQLVLDSCNKKAKYGDLDYYGNISNQSTTHTSYFTKVYFAVYNAGSTAVREVDYTYVDGSAYGSDNSAAIAPGATASYEVWFDYLKWADRNNAYEYAFDYREAQTYYPPTYGLYVKSSPDSGVRVTVSPEDNYGDGTGDTTMYLVYDENTEVSLTAPATDSGANFSHWKVGSTTYNTRQITVTMSGDKTATAYYDVVTGQAEIAVNRTNLYFGAVQGGGSGDAQTLLISNAGNGRMNWSVSASSGLVSCAPASGSGDAVVSVSLDTTGLGQGTYTYTLTIASADAVNSPRTVTVNALVKSSGQNQAPIGDFATPGDGSLVSSSIPVTGWVVDDVGLESVAIYLDTNGALTPIGAAVFVEGARTDIAASYPTYPGSYKAGWGYMLLSNFLPGGGNGTYTLRAIAKDLGGKTTDLGSKTITVDNAGAVAPFGAIDTPAQGGEAAGSNYTNMGWVLTPLPNTIPTDGSTIDVYIDNLYVGHPVYNQYRGDIAGFFPGYNNSGGSMATLGLNLDSYGAGIHQIYWIVTDNAGNGAGIGSRFFTVSSSGSSRTAAVAGRRMEMGKPFNPGFGRTVSVTGNKEIHLRECEKIRLRFDSPVKQAHRVFEGKNYPIPVGASVHGNTFEWFPAPGFHGEYILRFKLENKIIKVLLRIG